jgi:hypothetical protein
VGTNNVELAAVLDAPIESASARDDRAAIDRDDGAEPRASPPVGVHQDCQRSP